MKKAVLILSLFLVVLLSANTEHKHVVVKGDNLWDLAEAYLGDGFSWTAIWEKNQYIKNPHLIYPGDVLIIVEGDVRVVRANGDTVTVGHTWYKDTTVSFDQLTSGLFSAADDESREDGDDTRDITGEESLQDSLLSGNMSDVLADWANLVSMLQRRAAPFVFDERDSVTVPIGVVADKSRHMFVQFNKIRVVFNKEINYKLGERLDVYKPVTKIRHNGVRYTVIEPVATGKTIGISEDSVIMRLDEVYGEVRNGCFVTRSRVYDSFENLKVDTTVSQVDMGILHDFSSGSTIKPFSYVIVDKGAQDGLQQGDILQGYSYKQSGALDYFPSMIGTVMFTGKTTSTVRISKVLQVTTMDAYQFSRVGRIVGY